MTTPDSLPIATVRLVDAVTGDAGEDLAFGRALMELVGSDGHTRLIRTYRALPTAAFSRRESRLPGFSRAVAAAAAAGYEPVIRPTGGRVAVYDESSLVLDVIEPALPHRGHREAYERVSGAFARALRQIGVDAAVGQVPGEYCPGEFSVGARGDVKLVGIAQRAAGSARLVGTVTSVSPSPGAVDLLTELNGELGLEWDPSTCGAVENETRPGAAIDLAELLCRELAPNGFESVAWHRFAASRRARVDEGTPAA